MITARPVLYTSLSRECVKLMTFVPTDVLCVWHFDAAGVCVIRANSSCLKSQNELRLASETNASLKPGAAGGLHYFLVVRSQTKRSNCFFVVVVSPRSSSQVTGLSLHFELFLFKGLIINWCVRKHIDLNTSPCVLSSELHFELESPALKNNVGTSRCGVSVLNLTPSLR